MRRAIALMFPMMDSSLVRRTIVNHASVCSAAIVMLLCLGQSAPAYAQPARSLRAISVAAMGADAVVTIDADGPLPPPTVGAVDGPPRIFLDFAGVRTAAPARTTSHDRRIVRVRVAVHSVQPLVTRVVVDLAAPVPHRIEHAGNQMKIVIGSATATAPTAAPPPASTSAAPLRAPPASTTPVPAAAAPHTFIPPVPPIAEPPSPITPAAPNPPASSAPVTSFKPPPVPPSLKEVEKYRAQVLGTVERYRMQLPVLESLEDRSERTTEMMELAGLEIDRLRQELAAVKPPDALRVQHDLLLQSSRLAGVAIRLRAEALQSGNSTIMRNATSAGAGAVLMFDRACAEVGCLNDRQP